MNQPASTALVAAAPPKAPLVSGNQPRAIVPTDFDGAWRIANAVVTAGMAPRGLETAEKSTIAILHGLEVGLPPMMALQSIAVINGRPSLWGDGALALVQSSGLLEEMDESYEGQEGTDGFKAVCLLKRRGRTRPVVGEFSIGDAKTAGLWTKRGRDGAPTPWQTYAKRMLKMRARAFALRDGFSDVLKGLALAEEQEDVVRAAQSHAVDDGGGPPNPHLLLTDPAAAAVTHTMSGGGTVVFDDGGGPPVPPSANADDLDIPDYLRRTEPATATTASAAEEKWLAALEAAFADCRDAATLFEANDELMQPYDGRVSAAAWDDACDMLERHIERVQTNG